MRWLPISHALASNSCSPQTAVESICVCIYIFIFIHTYIYIYMYIHTCMCMYEYICMYIYIFVCVCLYTHIYVCISVYRHVCVYFFLSLTLSVHGGSTVPAHCSQARSFVPHGADSYWKERHDLHLAQDVSCVLLHAAAIKWSYPHVEHAWHFRSSNPVHLEV
jgi:hypothetical protein